MALYLQAHNSECAGILPCALFMQTECEWVHQLLGFCEHECVDCGAELLKGRILSQNSEVLKFEQI